MAEAVSQVIIGDYEGFATLAVMVPPGTDIDLDAFPLMPDARKTLQVQAAWNHDQSKLTVYMFNC